MSDAPDEFAGRYMTTAVESGVFDRDGDLLGHVGLLDVDGVDVHTARDVARSLPGTTALLRSSDEAYHVWSLAVRPLSEWIDAVDGAGVDAAHVELSESRGCSVLRLDRKVSVETGDAVKPAPRLLGVERTDDRDATLSAPHARLLADEFGATLDPDRAARGEWVGHSADTRLYMADVGGRGGE